jgi:outer membrane protein
MKPTAIRLSMAVASLLAASTLATAQAPTQPAAALKVATITFNTAVLSTADAHRAFDGLKTQFAPRQAQLQTLSNEVDSLQKDLQTNGQTLSESARATRERTLNEKQRQLQRQADDLKSDSTSESQQIYSRLAQKLYAFLQTYVPKHGYTMVVERGSDSNPIVWYADKSLDITSDVIKAYDAQAGAPAAAATKPPASTAAPK